MLKKLFIVTLLTFSMFSCFFSGDPATEEETKVGLLNHDASDFSISVPSSREFINDQETILPKPNLGKIELAITAKELKNGLANNLLILSSQLNSYTTSTDYSMLNNVGASQDYLDYLKLETKEFSFKDEEKSIAYIFEAKYNIDTPKLKFIQTARVCKTNKAFHFTIAIPVNTIEIDKYLDIIKTFACK